MFTEMVNRKIQQLEDEAAQAKQDQVDGSLWTRFRKRINAILRYINIGLKSLGFKHIDFFSTFSFFHSFAVYSKCKNCHVELTVENLQRYILVMEKFACPRCKYVKSYHVALI